MATVPGPQPDQPLPPPAALEHEPDEETEEDDRRVASPPDRETTPDWMPEPYDPEEEIVPGEPVPMP